MLSDEVKASITAQTKKKFHISFIKLMQYEVRNDKFDQRVVVLAKHGQRLMIFSNKSSSRLELNLHYLDIKSIESSAEKELKITHGENKTLRLLSLTEENEVDEIVLHIGLQLKTVFPLLPLRNLIPRIDLTPTERMERFQRKLDDNAVTDLSACSGFSRMYICMCDVYGYNLVEEIIWDLDTIYLSQDSRTLYLRDFDHLSLKDHVPLLAALQYNEWFSGVDASGMKMSNDALAEVLKVIKRNTSIAEWNLASTGLKTDFMQKFSTALAANLTTKLVSLDFSGNTLEDKGLMYLSEAIANMAHGMQSISLSQCLVTVRGVNKLMEGITQNHIMANTLHTLNLSSNNLKGDELLPLYNYVAQPNVLQRLNLADTDSPIDVLITALSRGSVQHLEELNVSGNPYSSKKSKDVKVAPSWRQFFSSVLVLAKIDMSNCRLPAPAMKELMLGLSANVNKPSVELDLSNNDMRTDGGMVLGSCVANLRNIRGLDLSDNGLDANLHEILPWFGKNGTIYHLSIGKNFSQLRNKALLQALDALVSAIQDEHCALESLSIADSKLKLDATVVINALGSSSTLRSLDISGNQIGDIGAKMLAKALTINSTLTNVVWDRNGITAAGLRDVAQSLQRNFTMQEMPLPIFDIAACTKTSPEIIQKASMQIQTCLQRNHAPRKMAYDQCYRLQQGFLVSSAQAIIDKRVHEIHSLLNSLSETDNLSPGEFSEAKKLLSDADKSKQILMALQTAVIKCEEAPNQVTECVKEVTSSLSSSVNSQLEKTRQEMMRVIATECMTVLDDDKDNRRMFEDGARSRSSLDQSEISSLIDRHLVSDIQSLISSRNFNVAFYIAESVIDKIVDMLNSKHDQLKAMTTASGGEDGVSLAPSELSDTVGTSGMTYLGDVSLDDCVGDRQSMMNTLRRRPQSILDFSREMKLDADMNIPEVDEPEEVVPSKSRKASGSAAPSATAEPELKKLPDVEAAPVLKHLNKERPKRAKKQVTRRPVPSPAAVDNDGADLEAVDDFFKPATVSQTPVLVSGKLKPTARAEKADTPSKSDKADDSPKLKQKAKPAGSHKEKVDSDKKKGGMLASGISNFFKKKNKTEKPVETIESKAVEPTPAPPPAARQEASTPKSRSASVDIPETQETSETVEPAADTIKTASLERSVSSDAMTTSAMSTISESEGAPVPAPKKRVGVGLPGMSGGLLAEMQSKRISKQPALQPKVPPKAQPRAAAKTEETTTPLSPPARPQPPVLKSPLSATTSDASKEGTPSKESTPSKEGTPGTPPARPTPPKPTAAPRESTGSTQAPAKPPVLRPKPPPKMPKPAKPARPATVIDMPTRPVTAKTGGSMKISSSQGDLAEDIRLSADQETSSNRDTASSSSARDSIAEELSIKLRDSKRNSAAARLSNGSVSQDKRLSTPTSQSAHLEDGPVLRPPGASQLTKQSSEEAKADSEEEAMV